MMRILPKRKNSAESTLVNALEEMQHLIDSISPDAENRITGTYINAVHSEFVTLSKTFEVPQIPVKELSPDLALEVIGPIVEAVPQFLRGHVILPERVPAAEQHSLHFVKKIPGRLIDFCHIFKIDLKFGGNPDNIIERGNSDLYPSYRTDRLYYKSMLIPESSIHRNERGAFLEPIRLQQVDSIESDEFFHTFAIFDEVDKKGITKSILQSLDFPEDFFPISTGLYSFINYDYFTSCFNVLHPTEENLKQGAELYEVIFLSLYSHLRNIRSLVTPQAVGEEFGDLLRARGVSFDMTKSFLASARPYFEKYSLVRDDDLALNGWWKFQER